MKKIVYVILVAFLISSPVWGTLAAAEIQSEIGANPGNEGIGIAFLMTYIIGPILVLVSGITVSIILRTSIHPLRYSIIGYCVPAFLIFLWLAYLIFQ